MINELQALTQRLALVERQLAEITAFLNEQSEAGQSEADRSVIAKQFIVVDQEGRRRAELGTVVPVGQTDERPWLGLFNANDEIRACIGTGLGDDPEAAWVELYAADQAVAVNVTADSSGPRILMFGEAGQPSMAAHAAEGGPRITLFGADGEQRLSLSLTASGEPQVSLEDARGERVLKLDQVEMRPRSLQGNDDPVEGSHEKD